MHWEIAASNKPEGRAGHSQANNHHAPAQGAAASAVPVPAVPEIGPPLNPQQAELLLKYLAAEHGLPGLELRVQYSNLLQTQQPSARVDVVNASALGMNGEMLAKSFLASLHASYGLHTDFDSKGMRCNSVQVLSNIIALSLLDTPLNTRDKVGDYLRDHKLLPPLSTQLELDLPKPEQKSLVPEAPPQTEVSGPDAVIEARGAEHTAPATAKRHL